MNQLPIERRAHILRLLVEGNSMRSVSRLASVSVNTVAKLLIDAGNACSLYQDKAFVRLPCRRLQCDEVWSFVGRKEKNAQAEEKGRNGVWTWAALCTDTKLVPCWFIGSRDGAVAHHFMRDLTARLALRVQLTADTRKPCLQATEGVCGSEIDYAHLVKVYGTPREEGGDARYSPARGMGPKVEKIVEAPDFTRVSSSDRERENPTVPMPRRQPTRWTNALSKKIESHAHAIALQFMHYNFCRIHKSLQGTPAMEAGISDHVWATGEVVALLDKSN